MKKIGFVLGVLLLVVSCNKDQRAANKFKGLWNVTNIIWTSVADGGTEDLITTNYITETIEFGDCSVKNGENCTIHAKITYVASGNINESDYTYTLFDKGTKMIWHDPYYPDKTWTVESISRKKAVLKSKNSTGEYEIEMRLEKI